MPEHQTFIEAIKDKTGAYAIHGLAPALAHKYADMMRALGSARPDLAILVTESKPLLLKAMADRMITLERSEIQSEISSQTANQR